jgi:4-hydroxy-4-methyl-2-oxoglutarate aldolase
MPGSPENSPWGEDPLDSSISVPMLSDSLDRAGLRGQVLVRRLAPLVPLTRASGRARTVRFVPDDTLDPEHPYDDAIDFIDGSEPGDFIVLSASESDASAFWGELFSAAAQGRKVTGMLTDGNVRDSDKISALGFPVFTRSRRPVDFRGRMRIEAQQTTVNVGEVAITPGDLIVADDDGIVAIPQEQEKDVVEFARERARAESTVLAELLRGSTLRDVWTRHGIL